MKCFFATDLHGYRSRYESLIEKIRLEKPAAVFLGGDLLPSGMHPFVGGNPHDDFITEYLAPNLLNLKKDLSDDYPAMFVILGNDDARCEEEAMRETEDRGVWRYIHHRKVIWREWSIYGYNCIPPSPFQLKDWERYDISRYIDPGCISPEEGRRTVPVPDNEIRFATIQKDLDNLTGADSLERAVCLFHVPPYRTKLDRAALDGKMIDHVPLDVHIGSIAVQRFIKARQPLLTLHGHVHESTRLTGSWQDIIGETHCFNGAHDGPELSLIRFDLHQLSQASREIIV